MGISCSEIIEKIFCCNSGRKRHLNNIPVSTSKRVSFSENSSKFYYLTYTNIIVNDVTYPVYKCYGNPYNQYIKVNDAYLII
jgi:hypothetical protein